MPVATDRPSAVAAKAATATIPIVFAVAYDPVKLGLAASLNRPGGNATGMSVFGGELGPKRLGLLRELLPNPGLIAFVVNPNSDATPLQISEMQSAAQFIGLPLQSPQQESRTGGPRRDAVAQVLWHHQRNT